MTCTPTSVFVFKIDQVTMKALGIATTQYLLIRSSLELLLRCLTQKIGGQGERFERFEKARISRRRPQSARSRLRRAHITHYDNDRTKRVVQLVRQDSRRTVATGLALRKSYLCAMRNHSIHLDCERMVLRCLVAISLHRSAIGHKQMPLIMLMKESSRQELTNQGLSARIASARKQRQFDEV